MAKASFLQSSFLGGIFSPSAQGRMTDPAYKTGLNECLNSFPIEEGAWTRRPGFRYVQHTRRGVKGRALSFDFTITQPYQAIFSDSWLRFVQGLDLVKTTDEVFVSGISTATPALVVCVGALPDDWADGDTVMFSPENIPCGPQAVLCNRQFTIANTDGDSGTFTLQDPITGNDIDGSTINYIVGANLDMVQKVFELATPYTLAELDQIRILSDDSTVLILHPSHQPRVLTTGTSPFPFAIAAQDFEDGPWLDTNTTTTTLTLSDSTGSVTVEASSTTGINNDTGFQTTDVGRLIRFQGGPPLWASATAYSKGDQVTGSDGNIYVAQGGMTGLDPTLDDGTHWTISPAHVNWIWLKITARTDTTHVTADIKSDLRTDGTFATVQGNTNIRAAIIGDANKPGLIAKLSQIDFSEFFAVGQTAVVTNGAFTDGGGGDISGTYTVRGQWNDPDSDNVSYLQFTDDGGQTAAWATVSGLPDNRTADYSPSVGQALAGDELSTTVWRLGAYSDSTGWPASGAYHEGRRWLTGQASNRVDASMSPQDGTEDNFNKFSPTGTDGTVADDNGITAIANAGELNIFFWMLSGEYGLLLGAQAGEWLLRASALDDPISPSSIQMRRISTYGCFNAEPQFCTRTTAFVQRQGRRVLDIANYPYGETAGWYADNLTHLVDSLTGPGIVEIRYQQTPTWNLWARDAAGNLIGSVFRHAAYGKDSFNGWHRHEHGGDRTFVSISTGPSFDGLSDTIYAITNQTNPDAPDFGIHWIECAAPLFDSAADECSAFHVDGGAVPCCTELNGTAPNYTGITIYGLWHLNGQTVQPFLGGLDLGDYTVVNGSISITFADASKGHDAALFTLSYFQELGTCDLTGAEAGSITTTAVSNPNVGDLEAFVAAGTPVEYVGSGGLFFVDRDVPYVVGAQSAGGGNNGGMQVFNKNTTGDELGESDNATIFGAGPAHTLELPNNGYCCLHPNGHFYCVIDGISNSVAISSIRVSDRSLIGLFGTASADTGGSSPTNLNSPTGMIPVVRGENNYLVSCGFFSREVAIWNLDDPDTAILDFIDHVNLDSNSNISACEGVRGRGDYYIMGGTSPIVLYEGWAPGLPTRTICTVNPSDIDPTWSNITGIAGPGFDAVDGNLLFFAGTNDAVTHTFYLVKVDRITGAVLWTSSAITNANGCDLTKCIINGTLDIFYDGGIHAVTHFDLSDGSSSTTSWNAGIDVGAQFFDGTLGSIWTIGSYTHSTGPTPTLIGEWFGSNATVSTRVMEIYSSPSLFSTDQVTVYEFYGCVGLTYNSDCQLLRPDFGQDAGNRMGPSFSQVRRISEAGMSLVRTRGLSVGTQFDKMNPVPLKTSGGRNIAAPTLFSGVIRNADINVNDDYGTASQLCWRISRPYPSMVTAIAGVIDCSG